MTGWEGAQWIGLVLFVSGLIVIAAIGCSPRLARRYFQAPHEGDDQ